MRLVWAGLMIGCIDDAPCPTWAAPEELRSLEPSALDEASGMVLGADGRTLWTHSDGGDPILYGIPVDGGPPRTVDVLDAHLTDWEAIARDPAGGRLFVGDLGDNEGVRTEASVWVIDEPTDDAEHQATGATEWPWVWPDGPRDVEGLLWDPVDALLVAFTKDEGASQVWVMPEGGEPEEILTLEVGGDALPGGDRVVAADLSADGGDLIVRSTSSAWLWRRSEPSMSILDLLATDACPAAVPDDGEAIAFDTGSGFFTVAEGSGSTIWHVPAG